MRKISIYLCFIMVILLPLNIPGFSQNQGTEESQIIILPGLTNPHQLLVDTTGKRLYISDGASVCIYSLQDFKLVKRFGKKGDGPGQFNPGNPVFSGLTLDLQNDRLLVGSQDKISIFTPMGQFKKDLEVLSGRDFSLLGNRYLGKNTTIDGPLDINTLEIYNPELIKVKELTRSPSWSKNGLEDEEIRLLFYPTPNYAILGKQIYHCGSSADFVIDVFDWNGEKSFTIKRDYQRVRITKKHSRNIYKYPIEFFINEEEYQDFLRKIRLPVFFPALRQISADSEKQTLCVMTFNTQPGVSAVSGIPGDSTATAATADIPGTGGADKTKEIGKEGEIMQVEFFFLDTRGQLLQRVFLPVYIYYPSLYHIAYLNDVAPFTFAGGKLYQLVKEGKKDVELHITPIQQGTTGQEMKSAECQWVKRAGLKYYDHSNSLTIDSKENITITGTFEKISSFEGNQLPATGKTAKDIFIAKYDASGLQQWTKQAGGNGFDEGLGITHDSRNNLIVTGFFQNSANFDSAKLISAGDRDMFLAKYDSSGRLLWVKHAGGSGVDIGYSVTCDPGDNIIVSGTFRETAAFDGQKRSARGYDDIFIAKYDPEGNLIWLRQAGGKQFDHGFAVTTDTTGNIYATGFFKDSAGFESSGNQPGIQLTSYGDRDIFLVKYTPQGEAAWAVKAGGSYWDYGYALTCDNQGDVYVTGFFYENARFEEHQLKAVNQNDMFLAKYNPGGQLAWVRQAGGTSYVRGKGVAADNEGNIYVTGHFKHNMTFPEKSLTLTAHGAYDIFLAKYDDQGNFSWASHAGGLFYDEACAIAPGKNHTIYITGEYSFFGLFGQEETGGYYTDVFLSKFVDQ